MRRFIGFVFLGVLLVSCQRNGPLAPAPHGVTVSSGGELIADQQNPWWVRNTKLVHYCIVLDSSSVSAPLELARSAINRALAYWKKEFARRIVGVIDADATDRAVHYLGVGAQDFVETACDGNEDLRFQFGYGTLDDSQKAALKQPERFAAATIRTSYNEESLRGRGYIFINSDIGEHRFGQGGNVADRPWRFQFYLYDILLHELGHVFGIPHFGDVLDLMSARFPELLLRKGVEPGPDSLGFNAPFFLPAITKNECHSFGESVDFAKRFFELDESTNCVQLALDLEQNRLEVSTPREPNQPERTIGTVENLRLSATPHVAVPFWVPRGQKVFSLPPETDYVAGPTVFDLSGSGEYHAPSRARRPVWLQVGASVTAFPKVLGAMEGSFKDLIDPVRWEMHPPGE